MINLLPIEYKREIKKEYKRRIWVVSIALLSVVLFTSSVIFVISISYTNELEKGLTVEFNKLEKRYSLADGDTAEIIKKTNRQIEILDISSKASESPKEMIGIILGEKVSSIKITGLFYEKDDVGEVVIKVQGVAENRESLTSFVDRLERSSDFEDVKLPISNLVKGKDINFNLEILVKK